MKKILSLFLLISINAFTLAQIGDWEDSIYTTIRNPAYPPINCVERTLKVHNEIKKKQFASCSYNPDGNTVYLDFEFFGYDGNLKKKLSIDWSICYDTILLSSITVTTDESGIVEDLFFYQNVKKKKDIGSLQVHKYYKNGKKTRKEYAPGEKWADLPYDPDSLFFELPKMLKLGDSILRIKHKYPRPE